MADLAGLGVVQNSVLGALCALAVTKFVMIFAIHKRKPQNTVKVGTISGIFIYPVKSCAGLPLQQAGVTFSGLQDPFTGVMDRHFMVVDDNGNFISQRKAPTMALIKPNIIPGVMVLNAPGMEKLEVPLGQPSTQNNTIIKCRVWDHYIEGVHCGEDASQWLQSYLGRLAHLVYAAPRLQKRELHYIDKVQRCRPHDKVAFQDWGQLLVISNASLAELNTRLKSPVIMANFRPNITVSGCPAHSEDSWDKTYIDKVQFTNVKLCGRCVLTTIDTNVGQKDPNREPLKTLKTYRLKPGFGQDPCFGTNVFCDIEGVIKINDQVEVTLKED